MNILIACEESQVECIAFRKKGHNAFSCDLQPCSGGHPEWHIQGDVLDILNPQYECYPDAILGYGTFSYIQFETMDGVRHQIIGAWDMIIAHPPCTKISNAGAVRMFPGGVLDSARYEEGKEAVSFFMDFLNADCDRICVENPIPLKCLGLPPYSQKVSPAEFGSDYKKSTCYWLKGLPPLIQGVRTLNAVPCMEAAWFNNGDVKDRAKRRSKSFPEIAEAMAQQWG